MKQNLYDDAEKNFEKAYQYSKDYLKDENYDNQNMSSLLYAQIHAARTFSGIGQTETYQKMVERCDSLLKWFKAQPTRLFLTLAKQCMMPAEICTRMNDALSGEDNESGIPQCPHRAMARDGV